MTGFMTIPKLARELNLSDATIRRYIKNFPQFFKSSIIDGWDQYPVDETIKVLKFINENSAAGQRKGEVLAQLMKEFAVVESEAEEVETETKGGVELGSKTLAVLSDIRDSLKVISEKMT